MADLVEDALTMNSSSFARHDIQVIKEFENNPPVTVEKPLSFQGPSTTCQRGFVV